MKSGELFWERYLPGAVLFFLVVYTLGFVVAAPYAGFSYNQAGLVTDVFEPGVYGDLRKGDRLQQVGDVVWDEFGRSRIQVLFMGVAENEIVQLHIWRGEELLVVAWRFPGRNWAELRQRLNSEWWLPYVFWLAGAATVWLIRPKGRLWRLLTGVHFLTAVWLVTGTLSSFHLWFSIFISHAALWLCLPLYWQLHLYYPQPLPLPKWLVPVLYGVAGIGILLDWLGMLPRSALLATGLLTFGGSMIWLLIQATRPKQSAEAVRLLLLLVAGFAPVVVVMVATLFGVQPFFQGGVLLGVATIPGIYFMAAYRPQLPALRNRVRRLLKFYMVLVGVLTVLVLLLAFWVNWLDSETSTLWWGNVTLVLSLLPAVLGFLPVMSLAALAGAYYRTAVDPSAHRIEVVANRVFTPYLFAVLVVPAMILLALGLQFLELFTREAVLASLVSSITAVLFTLFTYAWFARWVERFLFGLPPLPPGVIEMYSNRLATVKNRQAMVELLRDEVLAALQVRESALFLVDEGQKVELLYQHGLDADVLPPVSVLLTLMSRLQQQLPLEWTASYGWVQLVLPLQVQNRWLGVWLLGRHDPDGLYGRRDLPLYETLAAQTAVALINFTQSETLYMLYKMNIERHEQERLTLAHDLHDVTLSQLAVMAMYVDGGVSPKFHELYRGITHHLRQVITGLRPKMLDFGVWAGLNQLADAQMERLLPECELLFDLCETAVRYPPHVEQEIYRIVQQALENAITHANAELIRIHGYLLPDHITIIVEDNGVGLPYEEGQLPITRLLSEGHFGLAGMQERAAFIDAQMQLHSTAGEGTVISLEWQKPIEG
ncbi:MAG: ATP-binding protein [Chloroflexota bacterium]